MIRGFLLSATALLLAGCYPSYVTEGYSDVVDVIEGESDKLAGIRAGMTESQVRAHMGTEMLEMHNGVAVERETRPFLSEERTLPNGWKAKVLYYRSRIMHHDGICTFDETTAVILLNGKVDTLVRGDRVESFLSALR
jgi:hypothetical protein